MHARFALVGATALLLLVAPQSLRLTASPAWYAIEDLGVSAGDSFGRGLSPAGVAVGYGYVDAGGTRGFRFDTAPEVIPTFGGSDAMAVAINGDGLVVGSAARSDGAWRAFTWAPDGTLADLGSFGGPNSFAYAVNDAGLVAGYAEHASGAIHAFRYNAFTGLQDLGTLPGGMASFAYGINAAGEVVGQAYTADGWPHAFRYRDDTGMVDLGTLGGPISTANAVNAAGVLVGASTLPDWSWRALIAAPGAALQDLGTLGGTQSSAEGINGAGMVVGWSTIADGQQHAFRWTSNGGMQDLNDLVDPALGWTLLVAYGVNDAGQIVGIGLHENRMRGFRLTPPAVTGDTTAPEIVSAWASPDMLWPPNHQMMPVVVTVDATDDSGEAPVCFIESAASSEPDDGLGDGDTANDIARAGTLAAKLRAERAASGPGRVYTLTVACTDGAGNTARTNVEVKVPPNRRVSRG